jgi:hypothetical protein
MIYVFDIDGTICKTDDGDYDRSEPYADRIAEINQLHSDGHTILYYTARGMGRTNNDVLESYKVFYDLTRRQLNSWGAKYHNLFLGKPAADIYIDDKGINDDKFFE